MVVGTGVIASFKLEQIFRETQTKHTTTFRYYDNMLQKENAILKINDTIIIHLRG